MIESFADRETEKMIETPKISEILREEFSSIQKAIA